MDSYPCADIDLSALRHNFAVAKQCAPNSKILAMLKANAYGHGLLAVAGALSNADAYGVARMEEAISLRQAHTDARIVLMSGVIDVEEMQACIAHQIDVLVHRQEQIDYLQKAEENSVNVWLKLDTGMHRLGFLIEQTEQFYRQIKHCSAVNECILMTHFLNADRRQSPISERQTQAFYQAVNHYPEAKCLAKSAAVLAYSDSHADWIRPGIMLYGVSPLADQNTQQSDLRAVMTLHSKVMSVRQLKKGDSVGYAATYHCPEDMPVAVVAIGYGDGYPRSAKNGTPVLVNGKRAGLIGRVSMDSIVIDIRQCGDVKVGDDVILWGNGLPAEEVASCAGTIAYELFCRLTARVNFRYRK